VGPSAGYIYGWIIKMLVIKAIINYNTSTKFIILALLIGAFIDLSVGGLYLALYNQLGLVKNIFISLTSFLPIEILKIIIVIILIKRIPKGLLDEEVASEINRTAK
jgi:biotin transporter BioY